MSEIDWSKAPEGATHCTLKPKDNDMYRSVFWRVVDGKAVEAWPVGDDWSDQGHFEYGPEGCDAYLLYSSVERPSSSWTGTGLPQVGTVCEGSMPAWGGYRKDWMQCRVIAHEQGSAVVIRDGTVLSWCDTFRPIRTQAQIEAEERERAIDEMYAIIREGIYDKYAMCSELYDAGYRKQGEAK